jgi:methionyl-tRNA formyltransferase
MKEVVVPPRERKINALLSSAREEDLLLRTADGSKFLLTAVDDFDQEIVRTRQNQKLMALLEERRKETERIPWEQAKRELGLR